MASPLPAPTASTAKAPKPKRSPPTAEELCLKTFRTCWYLDKDWLVSFIMSAQRAKADAPITWVEFVLFFFFFFLNYIYCLKSTLRLIDRSSVSYKCSCILYVKWPEQGPYST